MVRSNINIKPMKIFGFSYLISAYADDTTFFVEDAQSITEINNTFLRFSIYFGLKFNDSKCEICGIGSKKGDKTALCGFKNVDLTTNSIRVLGVFFLITRIFALRGILSMLLKRSRMFSRYGICVALPWQVR